MNTTNELIIDNFAGRGRASTGREEVISMQNTIYANIYKNQEGNTGEYIEHKQVTEEKLENTELFKWFNRVGKVMYATTAVLFIATVIAKIWMKLN